MIFKRAYSAIEVVAVVVFIAFCIGMISVVLGLMAIVLSLFMSGVHLAEIGALLMFYGLAIIFVCAGIGCFLPDKERVLVQ